MKKMTEATKVRERRSLLNSMATELHILWAGWTIATDDNRRTKTLYVGPAAARRWKRLLERAGKVQETKRKGRN